MGLEEEEAGGVISSQPLNMEEPYVLIATAKECRVRLADNETKVTEVTFSMSVFDKQVRSWSQLVT